MHFDLFDPVLDIVETCSIIDGICKDDTHGTSVVCLCDRFETLLSCSIPDLKLDSAGSHIEYFGFKIDACVRERWYRWWSDGS